MPVLYDDDIEAAYDQMLDDAYGFVQVVSYTYPTSSALRELDPVAYNQGLADFVDQQVADGVWFQHEDGSIHDAPEAEPDDRDADDNKKW